MTDERPRRLTERQRECLRGVLAGFSAKEIAETLSISPGVVNEHLTASRRLLAVNRSIEAARLLDAWEKQQATPQRMGVEAMGVGDAPESVEITPDAADRDVPSLVVRERASTYRVDPTAPVDGSWVLPIPRRRGDRNDLSLVQRVAWGLLIAFLAAALAGAIVALQLTLTSSK